MSSDGNQNDLKRSHDTLENGDNASSSTSKNPEASSKVRKSVRSKKPKQIFTPEEILKRKKKLKKNTAPDRAFDTLPDGKPFCCDLCKSPYIINQSSKRALKDKRSRHIPDPKRKVDPWTGKIWLLCNSCATTFDGVLRPKKTGQPVVTAEEKALYVEKVKAEAKALAEKYQIPEAERFYCSLIARKKCRCIQRYFSSEDEETTKKRMREFIDLYNEAKSLSQQKSYISIPVPNASGKRTKKIKNLIPIGLGNGHKRSRNFTVFVLEKRFYLKNEVGLCERGTQRVLLYSNNFLHKKLKTEQRECRVKPLKGKAKLGLLETFDDLPNKRCCVDNCVMMALTHRKLLQQWRERASNGQTDARRVIAEMLTPSAGARCNCYNFITRVTGSSRSTIVQVNQQMIKTGGEREPPHHGLKKFWAGCKKEDRKKSSSVEQEQAKSRTETVTSQQEVTSSSSSPSIGLVQNQLDITQQQQLLQLQQQMFDQQLQLQQHHTLQQQLLQHSMIQQIGGPDNTTQNLSLIQKMIEQLNVQIQQTQTRLQQSLQHLHNITYSVQQNLLQSQIPTVPQLPSGSQLAIQQLPNGSQLAFPQSVACSQIGFQQTVTGPQFQACTGSQINLPQVANGMQITLPQANTGSQLLLTQAATGSQLALPQGIIGQQIALPQGSIGSQVVLPQSGTGSHITMPQGNIVQQIALPQGNISSQFPLPQVATNPQFTPASKIQVTQLDNSQLINMPQLISGPNLPIQQFVGSQITIQDSGDGPQMPSNSLQDNPASSQELSQRSSDLQNISTDQHCEKVSINQLDRPVTAPWNQTSLQSQQSNIQVLQQQHQQILPVTGSGIMENVSNSFHQTGKIYSNLGTKNQQMPLVTNISGSSTQNENIVQTMTVTVQSNDKQTVSTLDSVHMNSQLFSGIQGVQTNSSNTNTVSVLGVNQRPIPSLSSNTVSRQPVNIISSNHALQQQHIASSYGTNLRTELTNQDTPTTILTNQKVAILPRPQMSQSTFTPIANTRNLQQSVKSSQSNEPCSYNVVASLHPKVQNNNVNQNQNSRYLQQNMVPINNVASPQILNQVQRGSVATHDQVNSDGQNIGNKQLSNSDTLVLPVKFVEKYSNISVQDMSQIESHANSSRIDSSIATGVSQNVTIENSHPQLSDLLSVSKQNQKRDPHCASTDQQNVTQGTGAGKTASKSNTNQKDSGSADLTKTSEQQSSPNTGSSSNVNLVAHVLNVRSQNGGTVSITQDGQLQPQTSSMVSDIVSDIQNNILVDSNLKSVILSRNNVQLNSQQDSSHHHFVNCSPSPFVSNGDQVYQQPARTPQSQFITQKPILLNSSVGGINREISKQSIARQPHMIMTPCGDTVNKQPNAPVQMVAPSQIVLTPTGDTVPGQQRLLQLNIQLQTNSPQEVANILQLLQNSDLSQLQLPASHATVNISTAPLAQSGNQSAPPVVGLSASTTFISSTSGASKTLPSIHHLNHPVLTVVNNKNNTSVPREQESMANINKSTVQTISNTTAVPTLGSVSMITQNSSLITKDIPSTLNAHMPGGQVNPAATVSSSTVVDNLSVTSCTTSSNTASTVSYISSVQTSSNNHALSKNSNTFTFTTGQQITRGTQLINTSLAGIPTTSKHISKEMFHHFQGSRFESVQQSKMPVKPIHLINKGQEHLSNIEGCSTNLRSNQMQRMGFNSEENTQQNNLINSKGHTQDLVSLSRLQSSNRIKAVHGQSKTVTLQENQTLLSQNQGQYQISQQGQGYTVHRQVRLDNVQGQNEGQGQITQQQSVGYTVHRQNRIENVQGQMSNIRETKESGFVQKSNIVQGIIQGQHIQNSLPVNCTLVLNHDPNTNNNSQSNKES